MEFELKNNKIITVDQVDGNWSVNGESVKSDIIRISDNEFHVITEVKSYRVFVESIESSSDIAVLRVNGERLELRARGQYESLLESLGMNALASSKAKDLKAPMPGLVVEVPVSPGQEINPGDNLIILEAMKMENVIKADATGTVKEVLVVDKDSVEKGQILITFES